MPLLYKGYHNYFRDGVLKTHYFEGMPASEQEYFEHHIKAQDGVRYVGRNETRDRESESKNTSPILSSKSIRKVFRGE